MSSGDFPRRITSTTRVKSLVPLGEKRGRTKSNPCAATTELKPECDWKGLCFYGFTWKVRCNKGLFSSRIPSSGIFGASCDLPNVISVSQKSIHNSRYGECVCFLKFTLHFTTNVCYFLVIFRTVCSFLTSLVQCMTIKIYYT